MVKAVIISFFSGLFVFSLKNKHFLITLLSLEFMVISVFFAIFSLMGMGHIFFSLIFITFSACEGALGLSILVNMSRSYGSDYIFLFNFNY